MEREYRGKSVYRGLTIGPIAVLKKNDVQVKREKIEDAKLEIERVKQAVADSQAQLQHLYDKAVKEVGEASAAIFEVHQMMLEDEDYQDAIQNMIQTELVNAEYAVAVTGDNFAEIFASMDDEYMQARSADVKDISNRLVQNLRGDVSVDLSEMEPSIIVADDLSPSETVQMDKEKILGFVTVHGSTNSHTAILARMMNIPALIGVPVDLEELKTGMEAVVDGFEGLFTVEPGKEVKQKTEEKMHEEAEKLKLLQELKGKETVTADGKKVHLYANIGSVGDMSHSIRISPKIKENESCFREVFKDCADILFHTMELGRGKTVDCFVIYLEVAVSNMILEKSVLGKFINELCKVSGDEILERVEKNALGISDAVQLDTVEDVVAGVFAGDAVFFIDGYAHAVKISEKGYPSMGVSEADREKVLRGSKEGFTDSVKTNSALIRKRIRNPGMKVKEQTIGRRSQTKIQILYIEGLARSEILEELETKLSDFEIDGVLDSGVIEQLTKENWLSPFPQFQTTERPDKCAMELLNGRVVLLVDNSPVGLLIPAVFNDFLQVSEDEYQTFELATFLRVLRYLAVGCAMLFSGLYLAVTDFHTQVLPTNLILSFAKARRGVPFPGLIETLFMEIAFESVREAGVRAPGPLGGTIGIVGGLIIGQAAVSANLVSPVVVVVVAVTALSALAIPNEEFSAPFRLLKFGFIFLGGTLGMFGILLGLYMLLSHIAELKSFGVPYLAPYAGTQRAGYRGKENGIWMLPARFRTRRPLYAKESQKIKLRMKTSDEEERKK